MTQKKTKKKAEKPGKKTADTSDVLLSADSICVSYGHSKKVLSQVSFQVVRGEVFGLIGLNGAGKTSFIKVILGLLQPDSGHMQILGRPVHDEGVKKAMVSLPEKFEPPHFLTGREFIRFALSLYGHAVTDERLEKTARHLALDPEALDKQARYYSKGMKQKIGLMSCFLTECPIIVLDEPMSGLDPLARLRVKQLIDFAKKSGRSVFFSSHILADIDEICDRIAVVDEGVLKFAGTPKMLKDKSQEKILENAFLKTIDKFEPAGRLSA